MHRSFRSREKERECTLVEIIGEKEKASLAGESLRVHGVSLLLGALKDAWLFVGGARENRN